MKRWRHLALLLAALSPVPAARGSSQWLLDGIPVCTVAGDQSWPRVLSDGSGGAYIAWQDNRNGSTDVYLQRLTAGGQIAPGWPVNGVAASAAAEEQHLFSELASDGQGGVYLVWVDYRDRLTNDGDIYAQHVLGDGTVAPGWPANGLAIVAMPGLQWEAEVAPDDQGGAYFVWEDERNGLRDAYAQHVTNGGALVSGWPESGLLVCTAPGVRAGPHVMPDGQGGAFVTLSDTRNAATATDVYVQRLTTSGEPYLGWTTEGKPACTAPGVQAVEQIVPDGAGGWYLGFRDLRTRPPGAQPPDIYRDMYLQRITADGEIAPGWPALDEALPVCVLPGTQQAGSVAPDGVGGVFMAWEDYRNFNADVFIQHVTASGALSPGWPGNGLLASTGPGLQLTPKLAADALGGVYIAYQECCYEVFTQHLTGAGAVAPGWTSQGLPVTPSFNGDENEPSIAADGLGGAVLAWYDARTYQSSLYDIYAARLGSQGPIAIQMALVSAEAEPGLVRVAWAGVGLSSATVERRGESEAWGALAAVVADRDGRVEYEDHSVAAGARYSYRLRYSDGAEERITAETWVDVPAAYRFALEGVRPNPSPGAPAVAFTLASAENATLELFDLAGRRVASREVGSLGAGRHTVRIVEGAHLAAGVYVVRLTQGRDIATARAVVVN